MANRAIASAAVDASDPERAQLAETLLSLAHDLRSPLGALRHQAELLAADDLAADLRQRSTAVIERNATAIEEAVERLEAVGRELGDGEAR